jgi:HipA-like protein
MRSAKILYKGLEAATLTQLQDGSFVLLYLEHWVLDQSKPAISIAFPKTHEPYYSDYLFAFFYNMLPEGANKYVVCQQLGIDSSDAFSLLLATAQADAIGAIRVVQIP